MTPRTDRPYRQAALALMSNPPRQEEAMHKSHRNWSNPVPMGMRKR